MTVILLRETAENAAIRAFAQAIAADDINSYAEAYSVLLACDMQDAFAAYIGQTILRDGNLFAERAYSGTPSAALREAMLYDLRTLQALAKRTAQLPPRIADAVQNGLPAIGYGEDDARFGKRWDSKETSVRLQEFYRENGYGIFIGNPAFTYRGGTLRPVCNVSRITLQDLKDYEEEKRAVEDNIVNFVSGLPCSDMLLYGDKGTGKSSTVHAVLNKYASRGLRAVELQKDQLSEITALKELLSKLPFRFLLFIDDLSLEERDEKVTSLKASLEGSMSATSANVMIVATSNRRHILRENFSDRDNSVHARDTMEEQLSLSDRFGLTVCFSSTGKAEYLSIVRQLADDAGVRMPAEELCALAERWAIVKGGRSPRRARQFIDTVYACEAKNTEVRF